MKRETLSDAVGIMGVVIAIFSFINQDALPSIYRTGGFIISGILISFYIKYYIEDLFEEELNKQVENKMKSFKSRIDRMEGWKEAAEHFFPRGRGGRLDPITLLLILFIIIIIILYLRGKI
ncbi:hypothetical protein HYV88_02145 [Candidatus Woesearchaeota archaeon]|nr:hypothetical protein [Candidatus Woesearchaeota archaeon]